jgi:hypothetical protein
MKTIIKFVLFFVIIGVGFIAFTKWREGKLNKEGLQESISEYKEKGFAGSLQDISNDFVSLSKEAKQKLNEVDWNNVRDTLKLNDEDLGEYKDSLKWLYEEDSKINKEDYTRKTKDPVPVASVDKIEKSPKEPEPVKIVRKKEKPIIANKEPEGSKYYFKGMEKLDEAKAEGRKGIPGKNNFKAHLKRSMKLYQETLSLFRKAKKDPKCTDRQKKKIESLEPKINGQIYWGKKLGTVN